MSRILSKIDPTSSGYKKNHAAMTEKVNALHAKVHQARFERPERDIERLHRQKKLTVRERLDLLLDPGTPFLEIGTLVANKAYDGEVQGAGQVSGIGIIHGREVVIHADDPSIKGGAWYPLSIKKIVRTLATVAQERGAALLVEDDVQLSLRAGADGAHIRATDEDGQAALTDAIKKLKPSGIAGAGGLKTRHDAMTAGESEVDYVMFGEPARDGYTPPFSSTLERVEWWAEIFTVPVVGFASELAQVEDLAAAGADFVALGAAVWDDERGPASAIRDAMAAIARARANIA